MSTPSVPGAANADKQVAASSSVPTAAPPTTEQQHLTQPIPPNDPVAPSNTPIINSAPQQPVLASTPLTNLKVAEVEELRDRLFKLTSDYQRLYGVFMPNGEASPNAARWSSSEVDLPFLFSIRQRVVHLLTATQRVEKGEEVNNDQAFFETQRTFFNTLVGVVASAIERVTWLRRDLEGPDGYAYQYRSWYYQVIGNNPRSTNTSSAEAKGDAMEIDGGGAVSPSMDSEEDGEKRPDKRMKM